MGRESKSVVLNRIAQLSEMMKRGLDYSECFAWYVSKFGKAEKTFQKDRTIVYKMWKLEFQKDIEIDMIDILNKVAEDRSLARELGDAKAALQADKIEAQIKGIINRKGEVVEQYVTNTQINNNVIIPELTKEELRELLQQNE